MNLVSRSLTENRSRNDAERHARIVEAAGRSFIRHGFHAATMQNVAEEAGMSAGNLYRYFESKEALVEGLCRYDYDQRKADFLALTTRVDIIEALATMLTENVVGTPREKALLIVEIWAEAGRNPRISEITREFDAATSQGIRHLLGEAKSAGVLPSGLDVDFVATTMVTLAAGLFKRISTERDFDQRREADYAAATLRSLLSGATAPRPTPSSETN